MLDYVCSARFARRFAPLCTFDDVMVHMEGGGEGGGEGESDGIDPFFFRFDLPRSRTTDLLAWS